MILRIGAGRPAHERRDRDDLVTGCQLRVFDEVHDLDVVLLVKVLVAERDQVRVRRQRLRRLAGDVEPQMPALRLGSGAARLAA